MPGLTKLLLRDFQSHSRLVLALSPTVTTIVGPTDVGKSAVIRALRWVVQNRPSGEEFRRHGSLRTAVQLEVDGHKVKRVRSKADNTYELDGHELRAMGSQVPEEISQLLRLADLNFAAQHDAPFWLSETASNVSRLLNDIVDLSAMDTALGQVGTVLRAARSRREVCSERLAESLASKKASAFTLAMNQELLALEQTEAKVEHTAQQAAGLRQLLLEVEQTKAAAAQTAVPSLVELDTLATEVRRTSAQLATLHQLVHSTNQLLLECNTAQQELESAHQKLHQTMKGMSKCPLCLHPMS